MIKKILLGLVGLSFLVVSGELWAQQVGDAMIICAYPASKKLTLLKLFDISFVLGLCLFCLGLYRLGARKDATVKKSILIPIMVIIVSISAYIASLYLFSTPDLFNPPVPIEAVGKIQYGLVALILFSVGFYLLGGCIAKVTARSMRSTIAFIIIGILLMMPVIIINSYMWVYYFGQVFGLVSPR